MQTATATAPDGDLLTLTELATKLKIHPDTARRLYREDIIPGLKFGRRTLRFLYPDVLDALRAYRQAAK